MITWNEITQEPDNQSKKAKVDISIDETKLNLKLTPPTYTNNHEYVGGTNKKKSDYQTREYEDSTSATDGCARNIDDEHKNEEVGDYIDPPLKKNDMIESKLQEEVRNMLLSKKCSLKLIKAVMFNIDNHEHTEWGCTEWFSTECACTE